MSLFPSSQSRYCLTVVTLLDQLDPKEYNWTQHPVILQDLFISDNSTLDLIERMKENIEFSQIVSKFLMDRERAGLFWVNSQKYADLARYLLEFLHNKCVYSPYTPTCANTKAEIHFRHFMDVVDIHTLIPERDTTYYEVGKLAFNLLLILLSRIKALSGSKAHEIAIFLQSQPPFYSSKDDPLEWQKEKTAQAIEDFLKVWF